MANEGWCQRIPDTQNSDDILNFKPRNLNLNHFQLGYVD